MTRARFVLSVSAVIVSAPRSVSPMLQISTSDAAMAAEYLRAQLQIQRWSRRRARMMKSESVALTPARLSTNASEAAPASDTGTVYVPLAFAASVALPASASVLSAV